MAFTGEYKCSNCGKPEKKELLVVKKVMFQTIGIKPTTLRSRNVEWLCPVCVIKDPAWNTAEYSSPGMVETQPVVTGN